MNRLPEKKHRQRGRKTNHNFLQIFIVHTSPSHVLQECFEPWLWFQKVQEAGFNMFQLFPFIALHLTVWFCCTW